MERKRTRLQIIHDILQVIRARNGKIKPTHILYKSNLSHQMMEEYLRELISNKFIIEHIGVKGKTYSITKRGGEYLAQYSTLSSFMDSFGLSQ